MKFYQYKEHSDVRYKWQYIYTIINPNGFVLELNPERGRVETFDYNFDEYEDEEDSLVRNYNSDFIYSQGE